MKMKNETYDFLKKAVLVWLPAFTALWLTVGNIWNLPMTEEIGATIAAVTTFLGACIGISNKKFINEADEIDESEESMDCMQEAD